MATADNASTDPQIVITPDGERLRGLKCEAPEGGDVAAQRALEVTLRSFEAAKLVSYLGARLLIANAGPIRLCYVHGNRLGFAGLSVAGLYIWVSTGDSRGRPIELRSSALAHEFAHIITQRLCLLPHCSGDPKHEFKPVWGTVVPLAERVLFNWRASP